jgi:hypothetical protein
MLVPMTDVPGNVPQLRGRALHEFHTATTMDPQEVSDELGRLENAWEAFLSYLPPDGHLR